MSNVSKCAKYSQASQIQKFSLKFIKIMETKITIQYLKQKKIPLSTKILNIERSTFVDYYI